jgi:hypothetical protein
MLGEALATLASTGGTALVTAMVTDGWEGLRGKLARLLGRGDTKAEAVALGRLDESRAALTVAGQDAGLVEQELAVVWRTRLEDFLEREPEAAHELRSLVAEAQAATMAAGRVHVNAAAYDQAQQAVQGQGTMNVTFGGQRGSSGQQ